jgi:hypothetical protein
MKLFIKGLFLLLRNYKFQPFFINSNFSSGQVGFNNYYEKPYPLEGDSLIVYFENTGMNLSKSRFVVVEGKGVLRF